MIKLLLYLSIIILNINFFFSIKSKLYLIIFNNVDKSIINYMNNSFKNISLIINKGKLLKNNNINELTKKKVINIYFVDFLKTKAQIAVINSLIKLLRIKFIIKIDHNYPNYLFYNIFGCRHLDNRYSKSIKIAFFLENQIPDLKIADYAIGHAHINYFDRYFKIPYFFLYNFKNNILVNIRKRLFKSTKRNKFCAAVISNAFYSNKFRLKFIDELNKYKKIDMGGNYHNNVGKVIDKIKFLSTYKFSIAMENTEGDGYVSEKILDSLISGTIPIYYGDYMVDEYINPKSYILIRGEKDIKKKLELIKRIDNDNILYEKYLKANIFNDNDQFIKINNEKNDFLYHILEQDINLAKRIDNYYFK